MSLTRLDSDVLVHILCYVSPMDLLSLRATCKRINDLTFTRTIWISAVCRVMTRFRLSPESLPLSDLPTAALEDIALRPYRFESNVLSVSPSAKAIGLLARPKEDGVYSRHWRFIPGGRWLLSGDNLGTIKIWDLNAPNQDSNMPCVTSLELDGEIQDLQLQARPDGQGALILVSTFERDDQLNRFHVLTLGFSPAPIVARQATLDVGRIGCTTVLGNIVATTTVNGSVVVWNWVDDTWVEMIDPDRRGRNHDLRVKLNHEASVTTFDMLGGATSTYDVPTLHPRGSDLKCPPSEAVSAKHQAHVGALGLFSTIFQPDAWGAEEGAAPVILGSARQLVVYTASSDTYNYDVYTRFNWTRSYISNANRATSGCTVNDKVVVMINSSTQLGRPVEIHALDPFDTTPKVVSSPKVELPWDSSVEGMGPIAWRAIFCPLSGKVCMIPTDGPVHVFDLASA